MPNYGILLFKEDSPQKLHAWWDLQNALFTSIYEYVNKAQLGTRQLLSIATTITRQRNRASATRKYTTNFKASVSKQRRQTQRIQTYCNTIMQTMFWPKNMVNVSWQGCHVPSSVYLVVDQDTFQKYCTAAKGSVKRNYCAPLFRHSTHLVQ